MYGEDVVTAHKMTEDDWLKGLEVGHPNSEKIYVYSITAQGGFTDSLFISIAERGKDGEYYDTGIVETTSFSDYDAPTQEGIYRVPNTIAIINTGFALNPIAWSSCDTSPTID